MPENSQYGGGTYLLDPLNDKKGDKSENNNKEKCCIADFFKSVPEAKRKCDEVESDQDFLMHLTTSIEESVVTVDKPVLYNLCGYILHSVVRKKKKQCETCNAAVMTDYAAIEDNGYGQLVHLRDYSGDSLVYCSKSAFENLFVELEEIFQAAEKVENFLDTENGLKLVIHKCERIIPPVLPECHDLQKKLITRFCSLRMRFACQFEAKKIKAAAKVKQSGAAKASRSMFMKKSLEEVK